MVNVINLCVLLLKMDMFLRYGAWPYAEWYQLNVENISVITVNLFYLVANTGQLDVHVKMYSRVAHTISFHLRKATFDHYLAETGRFTGSRIRKAFACSLICIISSISSLSALICSR